MRYTVYMKHAGGVETITVDSQQAPTGAQTGTWGAGAYVQIGDSFFRREDILGIVPQSNFPTRAGGGAVTI